MGVIEARRRILLSAPHVEATTPAGVANFTTDLISPLKSLRAGFLPVQSGTGDPSPSNVRPISGWNGLTVKKCGKNLYDGTYVKGYINSTTFITNSSSTERSAIMPCLPSTTYTVKKFESSDRFRIATSSVYPVNGTSVSGYSDKGSVTTCSYTTPSDAKYIIVYASTGAEQAEPEMMVVFGETEPTSYSPYTGTTIPVTFPAAGKNLLNVDDSLKLSYHSNYSNWTSTNHVVTVTGNATGGYIMPCNPNTQYSYSFDTTYRGDNFSIRVYEFTERPSVLTDGVLIYNSNSNANRPPVTFTTTSTGHWLVVGFYIHDMSENVVLSNIQVELGSTATSYEPYRNAYYGGYVDLVRGEVVAEWGIYDMGDVGYQSVSSVGSTYNQTAGYGGYNGEGGAASSDDSIPMIVSDQMKTVSRKVFNESIDVEGYFVTVVPESNLYIMSPAFNGKTAAEVKTMVTGIKYAVRLKTPITYPLTPQIIKSLRGTNNIWSDANGDVSVEYWKH